MDTVRFISRFNGDGAYDKYNVLINKFIETPLDSVKGFISIHYNVHDGIFTEIMVPKIGMAYLEIFNVPSISGQNWIKRRLILTDYDLTE